MQSTKENPLAFFTVYFELGIDNAVIHYQTEKSQIQDYVNSLSGQHIPDDIRTLPFIEDEHTTFEEYILINIKPEIKKLKKVIELGFEKRFTQEKEINAYSSFLRKKLNLLCKLPN